MSRKSAVVRERIDIAPEVAATINRLVAERDAALAEATLWEQRAHDLERLLRSPVPCVPFRAVPTEEPE